MVRLRMGQCETLAHIADETKKDIDKCREKLAYYTGIRDGSGVDIPRMRGAYDDVFCLCNDILNTYCYQYTSS